MSLTLTNSSASKLSELSGLETAKRVFRGIWTHPTGIHAVLIYGAPGSGKSTLAQILAQSWLCKNPGSEGACGECRACIGYENGNAVDLLKIVPEGASNWIRLQAIRSTGANDAPISAQEFLRTRPLSSANKVVIIEDAERIYHDSFNAILKMLEEPPAHGRFILTTSQLSLVPATIRSRCMCINTEVSGIAANPDAPLWDRFCATSPGEAAEIKKYEAIYKNLLEFVEALPTLPLGAELKAAEVLRGIAEDYAEKSNAGVRSSQARTLESLARAFSVMAAPPQAIQMTLEAHRRILGNANAGIIFDALLVELASILRKCS